MTWAIVLGGGEESESPETLAAVQNTRNRQAENDLNNKEAAGGELSTKTVKAVTKNKDATGTETRNSLKII